MSKINKSTLWSFAGLAVMVALYVGASYLAQRYEGQLQMFVASDSILGMVSYVAISALAVVVAPFSTLPLIPLASLMWGWVMAAVLSIIGWVIGAEIAFVLARTFGAPLVRKIMSMDKVHQLERRLPRRHLFWTVVFLRMTIPVDVLSYALGLFSRINGTTYFWATFLGVIPFAFVFAYVGTVSVAVQIVVVLTVGSIAAVVYTVRRYVVS
jgi:uncharacterized membrane protein YdjX (TVP38/TMEM64 family)